MLDWLSQNAATVIISVILIAVVALVLAYLIKNKRQGKTTCGCGCKGCPNESLCHKSNDRAK